MTKKPKVIARNIEGKSKLFTIESLDLKFSNGEERRYERLVSSGPPAVLVVPMLDNDTVVMIREYGAGVDDYELALPKGRVETGENVEDAANRELMEEIGYGARRLVPLKLMSQSPGYMQHQTQVMLAMDLYEQREEGDEPEPIDIVPVAMSKIESTIMNTNLCEARSIAAVLLAKWALGQEALLLKS